MSKWNFTPVEYLRGCDPGLKLAGLLILAGMGGFLYLANQATTGSALDWDHWAVMQLRDPQDLARPVGPAWLANAGRDLTALGSLAILSMLVGASAGFLAVRQSYRMMKVLVISTSVGTVVSFGLKILFARPRPNLVPPLDQVVTSSFPSSHAMLSALVYLTLAITVAPALPTWGQKLYVFGLAILLTLLVGISRIYMGVHYPTDILAGWLAGLTWAVGSWLLSRYLWARNTGGEQGLLLPMRLPTDE